MPDIIATTLQFLRLLSEGSGDDSSEVLGREIALGNSIDSMASSMEKTIDIESEKEKQREYENECREKFSTAESESKSEGENTHVENQQETETICKPSSSGHAHMEPISGFDEKPATDLTVLSYHRKLTVLYELLSACLAATPEDDKNASTQRRRGYDARYRVALRLLATWFDIKWVKVV